MAAANFGSACLLLKTVNALPLDSFGSKTQLSAQCEAHYNFPKLAVPQAVCPVAAPHPWTLAPYPGAHLDQFYLLS